MTDKPMTFEEALKGLKDACASAEIMWAMRTGPYTGPDWSQVVREAHEREIAGTVCKHDVHDYDFKRGMLEAARIVRLWRGTRNEGDAKLSNAIERAARRGDDT